LRWKIHKSDAHMAHRQAQLFLAATVANVITVGRGIGSRIDFRALDIANMMHPGFAVLDAAVEIEMAIVAPSVADAEYFER
jgi:hypothetical protein